MKNIEKNEKMEQIFPQFLVNHFVKMILNQTVNTENVKFVKINDKNNNLIENKRTTCKTKHVYLIIQLTVKKFDLKI